MSRRNTIAALKIGSVSVLILFLVTACATGGPARQTQMDRMCNDVACPEGLELEAIEYEGTNRTEIVCLDSDGIKQGPTWSCDGERVSRTGQFEDGARVGTYRSYPDGELTYVSYASRNKMVLSCVLEKGTRECEIIPLPLPCDASKIPENHVEIASSADELEAAFQCEETYDEWKQTRVYWDDFDVAAVKVPIPEPGDDHYYYLTRERVVLEGNKATIRIGIDGECEGSPVEQWSTDQREAGGGRLTHRTVVIEIPNDIEEVTYDVELGDPPEETYCNTRP